MSKLVEMFQQGSSINVLVGVSITAILCAYLGVFVLLRREVMAGAVLVQVNPLGIALALYLSGLLTSDAFNPVRLSPLLLALTLTLIAATWIALPHRQQRPRHHSPGALAWQAIIVLLVMVAASFAIVEAASIVHAKAEMLYLLFGNRLAIAAPNLLWLAGLACLVGLIHRLFFREFLMVSFDPDMAIALGRRARWWNVLLYLTIGITITLAIRAVGALVVFNFLFLPAATALLVSRRLPSAFVLSVIFGVVSSLVGITFSYVTSQPSGPVIVGTSLTMLLLAGSSRLLRG